MNARSVVVVAVLLSLALACGSARAAGGAAVETLRVPEDGLQPQACVDQAGNAHLIYLTGDPAAADIRYARGTVRDGKLAFGEPVTVNAHPGSAIAIGTIRGPHMAVGKNGRVHVAWMGSGKAQPKALGKHPAMLYTRLADDGRRFEPERNVVSQFVGLDGGGSVAADPKGNVYVAWHAPAKPKGDEASRHVYVARSADDGVTFAAEQPVSEDGLGACACCGMTLLAPPGGAVVGLFRTARERVHRDAHAFLFQGAFDRRWHGTIDPAESATCVMSTFALADVPARHRYLAAWETAGNIRLGDYSYREVKALRRRDVPCKPGRSKHPSVAIDADGNVLVAWAEDTGWRQGGSVTWQLFDRDLRPLPDAAGRAADLPAWSRPAAVAKPGGGFVVIY